jgi:uncharacterized repeat protein (TIGR03803 family)
MEALAPEDASMPSKKNLAACVAVFSVIVGSLAITTPLSAAAKEKVLHRFCSAHNCADGDGPVAGVIFDEAGNLYGTTSIYNVVFELTPNNGRWTENVLHSFNPNGKEGYELDAALIMDRAGNLYGTTARGGASGNGTVFELILNDGKWTCKVLHNFDGKYGSLPMASLILDGKGNLYGTTYYGGIISKRCPAGCGTVFELTPGANGKWSERVLHTFTGYADGALPWAGLMADSNGNLYGTTEYGGDEGCFQDGYPYGCGTVFELTPTGGKWTGKVLHSFTLSEGIFPLASLVSDTAGNLYGSAYEGGGGTCDGGCGMVFELTPNNGKWTEKVLHYFDGKYGGHPAATLIFDGTGNLYGTAGVVFELTPNNGEWTEKVLYNFKGGKDGLYPVAGLVFDSSGDLFGTTYLGGINDDGTVFEITP